MLPLELLFDHHRRYYAPDMLEEFKRWFARSGYGGMLDVALMGGRRGASKVLDAEQLRFSSLAGVKFKNGSNRPWRVGFTVALDAGVGSMEDLFRNFALCTGHTHPLADFRSYLGYYVDVLSGPRFLLFHGAGGCLQLGAMFQALASRLLGEQVDLHYSHAEKKEFTHVFGTWKDSYLVDPDQKTWALLDAIDEVPSLGYIFQQFGVVGDLIYRGLEEGERQALLPSMTQDYFNFYRSSVHQYMHRQRHDIAELARLFLEARTKFCSPLSVDATDFAWKEEFRRRSSEHGVERPYFLVKAADRVDIDIPPGGTLRIGTDADELPDEVNVLSAIFFGRVPGSLHVPLREGAARLRIPEFPWLLVFGEHEETVTVNGHEISLRPSRCGRYRLAGMGELEKAFDLAGGHSDYSLEIRAAAKDVRIVLPFNAFALASGLVRCEARPEAGCSIDGTLAA
jgi:hypothetical protein